MRSIRLVDLPALHAEIRPELEAAMLGVLGSGRYVLGEKVAALESALLDRLSVQHAIGVSSGTDALTLALSALDVGPGDRVLTTPYTFFSTAGVIARLGAVPVFIDIDPASYNLSPGALADWLARHDPIAERVKAIVPVHLFGLAAEIAAIRELCEPHGIPTVEDAAQAIGATYPASGRARPVGGLGALGCFSFFPTKNLGAIGDGGLVTTDDHRLAARVKSLRSYGSMARLRHDELGGNFRLDEIQAAVLLVKLPHLAEWNDRRRRTAARYTAAFAKLGLTCPVAPHGLEQHVFHQYVLRVPDRRADLRAFLSARGIDSEVYYPTPLHMQPCFDGKAELGSLLLEAERASREALALPVHPALSDDDVACVIDTVERFFG